MWCQEQLLLQNDLFLLLWEERRSERWTIKQNWLISYTLTLLTKDSKIWITEVIWAQQKLCMDNHDVLVTYGLALLGSWKLCAIVWWLSGGGWGHRAGSVDWAALWTGECITPFKALSAPFISWGLPARDASSPPATGWVEVPAWLICPKLSHVPRPFIMDWLKEAGLCWGGGVLWKEREELLWDGLPEWRSWEDKNRNEKWI